MTVPANTTLEAAPYGAQPVLIVTGAQGGPYSVLGSGVGLPSGGDVAAGVADAGNPVKIGGKASTGLPVAVTTGQRVDGWFSPAGQLVVLAVTGDATADTKAGRLTRDAANTLVVPAQANYLNNGSTWDQQRGNMEVTLLASASRTVTNQSADQVNYNGRRLLIIVDVSVVGTGSITPSLQVKDPISGNYFTIWTAAAAIVTGATFAYLFEAGASGGLATEKLAFGLPARTWRLNMVHNNANAITYSVSANVGV